MNKYFTLGDCLFQAVKLTEKAEPNKYRYSCYGIWFDVQSDFSMNGELGKNVIILGIDDSSSVYTDKRKKTLSFWWRDPKQGLDDTSITAESKHFINFIV